jgi:hypothetical protein
MTAEVVIMNKSAVALAADSVVTIGGENGDKKTYNSVNKLFTLSKYQPVGAMIYGNASFMGVPWEVIIKSYRGELKDGAFPTVFDYFNNLSSFIENAPYLKDPDAQELEVWRAAFRTLLHVSNNAKSRCDASAGATDSEKTTIADEVVDDWMKNFATATLLPNVDDHFVQSISDQFKDRLREAYEFAFRDTGITLSVHAKDTLPKLAARAIACGLIPADSGVVFAGFGASQIFPSVVTISPLLNVCDRFLYKVNKGKCFDVSLSAEAVLIPFAQQDVVNTFLEGVDPQLQSIFASSLSQILDELPNIALEALKVDSIGIDAEIDELRSRMNKLKADLLKEIEGYKEQKHKTPLLDVIGFLPKDELAATAESLVSLTAIKRKMSLEIETVGGPIDVAVISKGDGFVWIKRKHYFKPELNPLFVETYFQR